jgi:hypothetical protein
MSTATRLRSLPLALLSLSSRSPLALLSLSPLHFDLAALLAHWPAGSFSRRSRLPGPEPPPPPFHLRLFLADEFSRRARTPGPPGPSRFPQSDAARLLVSPRTTRLESKPSTWPSVARDFLSPCQYIPRLRRLPTFVRLGRLFLLHPRSPGTRPLPQAPTPNPIAPRIIARGSSAVTSSFRKDLPVRTSGFPLLFHKNGLTAFPLNAYARNFAEHVHGKYTYLAC